MSSVVGEAAASRAVARKRRTDFMLGDVEEIEEVCGYGSFRSRCRIAILMKMYSDIYRPCCSISAELPCSAANACSLCIGSEAVSSTAIRNAVYTVDATSVLIPHIALARTMSALRRPILVSLSCKSHEWETCRHLGYIIIRAGQPSRMAATLPPNEI